MLNDSDKHICRKENIFKYMQFAAILALKSLLAAMWAIQ